MNAGRSVDAAGGLGIEFLRIEKRYGARFALRGVSLAIEPGECVALVGPNGSGKTTLLRVAALLVRPHAGEIRFVGADGRAPAALSVRRRMGFVAHQSLLYDELTAEENLVLFARLYELDRSKERAAAALPAAGLGGREGDLVRTFSRGMRQRLSIARALVASPSLLLLDEAETGLDPEGQRWLAQTLAGLRDTGCTLMMTTHGRSPCHALVTRVVELGGGKVARDSQGTGNPQQRLVAALAAQREEEG